jgi:PDDEXK-like domain of unknown function (DUF3799)
MKWDGGKIKVSGIYNGLPIETYIKQPCIGPSVTSSGLRAIWKSPAYFWCYSALNPNSLSPEESDWFVLGKASHTLLLGEDDFSTKYIVRPPRFDSWRTTESKKWRADQQALGRTVLLPSQVEVIRGMARSLSNMPLVKAGILAGEIEQSIFWKDEETGIWCGSRPDCIPNDSGDVCDLKTSTSIDYDDIARTIGTLGYHMQASLVGEGFKQVLKRPMTSFSLLFVEKSPPFSGRIVTLKDCDLERGTKQNRACLRIMADCLEKNWWPGPGDYSDAEFIEIPTWLQSRIDKELEYRGIK